MWWAATGPRTCRILFIVSILACLLNGLLLFIFKAPCPDNDAVAPVYFTPSKVLSTILALFLSQT